MRTLSFVALALLLFSGCATLFSGTDEDVTFRSEPSGAQIIIDGVTVGTTPATVEVDRPGLNDMDVTVELEGYEARTFELDKKFNNTAIWNILFWPGFIIDALTGALFRYDKTNYNVNLENGTVSLRLQDLRRGPDGEYLLPDVEESIVVRDHETGLILRFE
jgi:hypothetical protein